MDNSVDPEAPAYELHRAKHSVHLVLRGHFAEREAEGAVTRFLELAGADRVRFVVDLGELRSYDRAARVRWQTALRAVRAQLAEIVFVGDAPPLIRMAASAVALAVGVPMRFVESQQDVGPEPEDLDRP